MSKKNVKSINKDSVLMPGILSYDFLESSLIQEKEV